MWMWLAFKKLFEEGGWVLYPIFGVSVLAWAIALGKFTQLSACGRFHRRFVRLAAESRFGEKVGHAHYDRLLGRIGAASPVARERAVAGFFAFMGPQLERGLSTMVACVVMAPLLGLLGTISGMNIMFNVIGDFGFGSPSIMAQGISTALQATLTGLGVAVAALFLHNGLCNRKNKLLEAMHRDFRQLHAEDVGMEPEQPQGASMQSTYRLVAPENEKPEINLAPFVDTIMILLIFFVVTANLYVETGVDVTKPKAQSAQSVGQKAILVGVTREGSVHVYGRQVSLERLRLIVEHEVSRQPDISVVIIADREADVGRAVEVMDQCTLGGAQKVSLAAGKGTGGP